MSRRIVAILAVIVVIIFVGGHTMGIWDRLFGRQVAREPAGASPDTRHTDLLPHHDQNSAEGVAKQVVWAMDAVLRWDAPHPRAGTYVFRAAQEMKAVWRAHGGEDSGMPAIDFHTFMVVAIFVDEGTYSEVPMFRRIEERDDALVLHTGTSRTPFPSVINPNSVIKLRRVDKPERFVHD